MTAEREALLVRAGHVEARRQRAREQDDVDAMRHCERELAMLWRQWLEAFRPPKCQQQLAPSHAVRRRLLQRGYVESSVSAHT
jgi:hypothetical protein